MTDKMRILVVGAGATGGYFGGRLAEAGLDVTFLVRPGRAAQLAAGGLQILSEHGDLSLHPRTVTAAAIDGHYEVILLAVKAYGLEQALVDIAPAVGATTLILPLLNGLRHIDRLRDTFGAERVLGGVCAVSATLDERGRVRQLAAIQDLTYGPLAGGGSPAVPAVDALLQGAGFNARLTQHIMPMMWQKWIMLSSLGAFNCLMRGTVGEIIAVAGGRALADDLLAETAGIAAAAGYPLREAGRADIETLMTTTGSGFSSSMYRDLQAGGRVEVDAIIGDLVEFADRLDAPAPLLKLALVNLAVYQQRLAQ